MQRKPCMKFDLYLNKQMCMKQGTSTLRVSDSSYRRCSPPVYSIRATQGQPKRAPLQANLVRQAGRAQSPSRQYSDALEPLASNLENKSNDFVVELLLHVSGTFCWSPNRDALQRLPTWYVTEHKRLITRIHSKRATLLWSGRVIPTKRRPAMLNDLYLKVCRIYFRGVLCTDSWICVSPNPRRSIVKEPAIRSKPNWWPAS